MNREWTFFDPASTFVPYGMLLWQEEGTVSMIISPYTEEGRRQEAEGRSQEAGGRRQEAEGRNQKAEIRRQTDGEVHAW